MRTGVILAGGLGTRLRPLTFEIPKAMIDIDGRNLTEHCILILKRAGVEIIYLAIGHLADKVKDFFGDSYEGVKIKYIVEDEPLGTGGWMNLVDRDDFQEDFIVINGDDLASTDFGEMHKIHTENNALVTVSLHEIVDPRTWGVADLDGNKVKGFVEKPESEEDAPSHWANNGYYIFSPEVFEYAPADPKFMLEYHVFPRIAEEGRMFAYFLKGPWYTTNTKEQWENARKNWKL